MQRSRRKKHSFLKALILMAVIAVIYLFLPNELDSTVNVKIEQGLSTVQIADILKENGVISSKLSFLARVSLSEYRGRLKYGDFTFEKGDSYSEIIKKIATQGAKRETVTVSIPEGFSVEKIIVRLSELGFGTQKEIKSAMQDRYDYDFLKNIPSECEYKLQGFLFPATYEFYSDAEPQFIIDTMLKEFKKQYDSLNISYDDIFEIITKASLIEREAKIDSERAKIAGVIENRLKKDMKLQIDATVVYAISNGLYDVNRVLYKDLETDSPYNTYRNKGLPIGPIASPGLKSIKAATNPQKHSYLYYRTDESKNDGSHIFTENFEQHTNANK